MPTEISKITNGFKPVSGISLPKNKIEIDATFVRSERITPSSSEISRSYFKIDVYQNKNKIDTFELAGCSKDQPFSFAGYAIPGFEKKIALLSSAKGDCFEGGYTIENLQIVGGVTSLNKDYQGAYKSNNLPLVPNEGVLVVYEKDKVTIPAKTPTPTPTPISTPNPDYDSPSEPSDVDSNGSLPYSKVIVIAIATLLIGLIAGIYFRRRKDA